MKCEFKYPNGKTCGCYAMQGKKLCINHDPESKTKFKEARSRGGTETALREYSIEGIAMNNPQQIFKAQKKIIRLALENKFPKREAELLIEMLRNLASTFSEVMVEKRVRKIEEMAEDEGKLDIDDEGEISNEKTTDLVQD